MGATIFYWKTDKTTALNDLSAAYSLYFTQRSQTTTQHIYYKSTINEARRFVCVLYHAPVNDSKLCSLQVTTFSKQINKPLSSPRALNEWKQRHAERAFHKNFKTKRRGLWIWNRIRSHKVIWKSNDKKGRKKDQRVEQQTPSEKTKPEERNAINIQTKPCEGNEFTRHCFCKVNWPWNNDSALWHPDIRNSQVFLQGHSVRNLDLISLQHPDTVGMMQEWKALETRIREKTQTRFQTISSKQPWDDVKNFSHFSQRNTPKPVLWQKATLLAFISHFIVCSFTNKSAEAIIKHLP